MKSNKAISRKIIIISGLAAQAAASSSVSSGVKGASQEGIDRTAVDLSPFSGSGNPSSSTSSSGGIFGTSFSQQTKSIFGGTSATSTQVCLSTFSLWAINFYKSRGQKKSRNEIEISVCIFFQGSTFGSAPLFGGQSSRVPVVKPAALSTIGKKSLTTRILPYLWAISRSFLLHKMPMNILICHKLLKEKFREFRHNFVSDCTKKKSWLNSIRYRLYPPN